MKRSGGLLRTLPKNNVTSPCRDEHAGRIAQRGFGKKVTRPSQRREMAGKAVALRRMSIALACRTFGVSETCYRYSVKLNDDNEEIGHSPSRPQAQNFYTPDKCLIGLFQRVAEEPSSLAIASSHSATATAPPSGMPSARSPI